MEKYINNINKSTDIFKTIQDYSIDEIEKILIYASDKYYNDEPVITDAIFDTIREFLELKAPKSKVLKLIGAPISNIKSKDKVKLPYYLGSMDKIKPPSNKLDNWCKKYEAPYILTDKLDGVSALLVYSHSATSNNDIKLYTRGTATHGMDITMLLKYIKHIPSYDDVMMYLKKHKIGSHIAFRGELIITKNKFEAKWASSMKNARNAVAGLVNSKTINTKLAHDTSLVLYQVVDPIYNMEEQLEIIKELKFKTVHKKKVDELSFEKLSKYLLKRRTNSKYVIDGIIVCNNDIHPINKEGNPDYAWAFKDVLDDQKALSKVINIEWNQTKDNILMPTIIIEPVDVGGVTIQRVTGNNAKFIVDNKIGIGAEIEVIRSNDVIPKIEKVIKGVKVELPDGEWNSSGVHLMNTNKDTDDVLIKNIYYFFSTLNTVGLGEKNVEKIYNAGYTTILDFLKLKVDDIKSIEGFKQKSAENIVSAIKLSTSDIPLYLLMKASNKLGRGMGGERAKDVLDKYPNIMNEYKKHTEKEFINMLKIIDGWEEKTSTIFAQNFKYFVEFYESIKKYITINIKSEKKKEGILSGMKIVMSGFRDKELEEFITSNGGEISSGVSKNTSILIIKDDTVSGTSKVTKAKELGVIIHTIDSFSKEFNYE
jgi:NAD-dependent DNA ligase